VKIFELFDRVPQINNWEVEQGLSPQVDASDVQLDLINFSYPNRSSVQVLDKMSLTVKKGQKIALVGSSGCGKSTITQLLERFYDPSAGQIKIGDYLLKDLSLEWLRSQISIVSQEPILFDASIGSYCIFKYKKSVNLQITFKASSKITNEKFA